MNKDLDFVKFIVKDFEWQLQVHSYNVCNLAVEIAKCGGYGDEQIKTLATGALLHDIGKSCIDASIINKPAKLSKQEFEIVKKHTTLGAQILRRFGINDKYIPIILYHHERWDGKGYEGLYKEQIPELARIVTIADAFDAMTSYRPYQAPKSISQALDDIKENSGTQFSPEVVDLLETCLLNLAKKSTYIYAHEY